MYININTQNCFSERKYTQILNFKRIQVIFSEILNPSFMTLGQIWNQSYEFFIFFWTTKSSKFWISLHTKFLKKHNLIVTLILPWSAFESLTVDLFRIKIKPNPYFFQNLAFNDIHKLLNLLVSKKWKILKLDCIWPNHETWD